MIDLGVTIPTRTDTDGHPRIADVCGRIDFVRPDGPNLTDRGVVTAEGLRREYLLENAPDTAKREIEAGYIKGVHEEAPSVMALNMRVIIIDGDTPPAPIPTRHIYLCRDDGDDWSAAMRCPCGCGDELELMLLQEVKLNWSLTTKNNEPPTLRPSVWRKTGCKAHFWLRAGHIHWC